MVLRATSIAQSFVVIAGNEDDARAVADFPQQFLHHVVVCLRPVRATAHFPEIDDIADEIDRPGLGGSQEVEQGFGLGRARSQMNV
jgi:hypothetical protein